MSRSLRNRDNALDVCALHCFMSGIPVHVHGYRQKQIRREQQLSTDSNHNKGSLCYDVQKLSDLREQPQSFIYGVHGAQTHAVRERRLSNRVVRCLKNSSSSSTTKWVQA